MGLFELLRPQPNLLGVFCDPLLDPILDVVWIVGIPLVVWCNRHDAHLNEIVVPGQHVEGPITEHPRGLADGERVLGETPRRRCIDLLLLGEGRGNREFWPSRHHETAVAVLVATAVFIVLLRFGRVLLGVFPVVSVVIVGFCGRIVVP